MSSSMVVEDSVTLTSSIFMTIEVDVTITTSMKTSNEHTTSSHSTPTQTAYSEGTATLTQTVFYGTNRDIETPKLHFDYISSATPTPTVVHSFNEGTATPTRQPVVYKSKILNEFYWQTPAPTEPNPGPPPTRPRLIPISTNKAYGKLRVREGRSPTSTNETSREGEEVGYELVDVHRRESLPPPQASELEGMYEVPFAPVSPSHPIPTNRCPTAGDEEDTVYEVIPWDHK